MEIFKVCCPINIKTDIQKYCKIDDFCRLRRITDSERLRYYDLKKICLYDYEIDKNNCA
jgi:hypothetical protein